MRATRCAPAASSRSISVKRRRLADVVGLGLEREAPDARSLAVELRRRSARAILLGRARRFWRSLARSTASTTSSGDVALARGVEQRAQVLREARAAEAGAGEQELRADARVGADALADDLDVGADAARQRRASSFMNEMRVASIAFAAYLVSSAERDVHDVDAIAGAHEAARRASRSTSIARVVVGADDHAVRAS